MKKNYVWVIEMMDSKGIYYSPLNLCWLSEFDAKENMKFWKRSNPNDIFKVTKYMREEK